MAIKVKGETYQDAEELLSTIGGLEIALGELPSDTPEHNALAAHIEDLKAAVDGEAPTAEAPSPESAPPSGEDGSDEEDGDGALTPTHDLQVAYETGAPIVCPTCGQGVDFPEAPPMNPNAVTCDACQGWGKYVNPTRVDGWIWRECNKCHGNGFLEEGTPYTPQSVAVAAVTPQLAGSVWDAERGRWNPPIDAMNAPWNGARWDGLQGAWV